MATITATNPTKSTVVVGVRRTEIDSGATIDNAMAVGFNTDGEVIQYVSTAANVYAGIADGAETEGDGTSDKTMNVITGSAQIAVDTWTIASSAASACGYPLYLTAATTSPTFTRPSTYAEAAGYQDIEGKFVQFSEPERMAIGIAGGSKREIPIQGPMAGSLLSTNQALTLQSFGRKSWTKIGLRNVTTIAPTDAVVTFTIYKGTAIGTATSVGTLGVSGGTVCTTQLKEHVYTTAFVSNDGESIHIVPTSVGTAISAGSIAFFAQCVGLGGN